MAGENRCQKCGACCAMFIAVIDASEIDNRDGGHVPFHMTTTGKDANGAMKMELRVPIL